MQMVASMKKNLIIALLCGLVSLLALTSSYRGDMNEGALGYHLHYHSTVDSFHVAITVRGDTREFDKLQAFYRLERQGKTIKEGSATLMNSTRVSVGFEISDKDSVIRRDISSMLTFWGIGRDGLFNEYYLLKPRTVLFSNGCTSLYKAAKVKQHNSKDPNQSKE